MLLIDRKPATRDTEGGKQLERALGELGRGVHAVRRRPVVEGDRDVVVAREAQTLDRRGDRESGLAAPALPDQQRASAFVANRAGVDQRCAGGEEQVVERDPERGGAFVPGYP